MEKLQKALEKARRERNDALPGAQAAPRPGPDTRWQMPSAFPDVWRRLREIDVDPKVLLTNRIMTLTAKPEAHPFDILRTKIFFMMQQNGWTRLAITSPNKACGKSTIACNLAVGFSRQREIRTLLFDLDLRHPKVADLLGQRPDRDIAELLSGEVSAEDQMVRFRENVAISMAMQPIADPTQLLLSQAVTNTFDALQKDFAADIMIFDLPPMLAADDTRAVLKNVDCALIVARAEHTKISRLDICEREVGEVTNILGVVLNDCRHFDSSEEQYSGY